MKKWSGELVMGQGWFTYNGPLGDGDIHRHSAIQICIATDGKISAEVEGTRIPPCTVVVVCSNVIHRLQRSTRPATLLYLESSSVLGLWIRRIMGKENFYVPDSKTERTIQSEARRRANSSPSTLVRRIVAELWPALDLVSGQDPIDSRVRQTLSSIDNIDERATDMSGFAEQVGLSASRLRHLFTAQVGMSLSSYLLWKKLLHAARSLGDQSSLTTAAYAGGFADSAHMARTFRRMFGISPSDLTSRGSIRLDTSSDSFLVQNRSRR